MRKLFLVLMLGALLMTPSLASAQAFEVKFASVGVQLWPEYDQPSMLVIVDFAVPADTKLPVNLTFRIPQESNLVAIASYSSNGALLDAPVTDGPKPEGEWQVFTMTLDSMSGRFEYYQPITFNGEQRLFSYLWGNTYAVDAFTISALESVDTTSLTSTPKLTPKPDQQGLGFYGSSPVKLGANEQFTLTLEYTKTSDALSASPAAVQPTAPLDDTVAGRVSMISTMPYIFGAVGVLLMIGGVVYFLQAGKSSGAKKSRRRTVTAGEEESGSDVYCAQCGTRARGGDRFCRTCGSRIKQSED